MPARKVLLLGATGGTGREVLAQALRKGHEITVLVRNPRRLGSPAARVRVMIGDVLEGATLANAVRGQDVVLSTLGVGSSLKSSGLIGRSVPAIARAMESEGVARMILISAYGVGETIRDAPLVPRLLMRLLLRDVYADKLAGDDALRRSSLDWTIVHPVTLTNGPRSGKYRVGERLALRGFPRVSRADVADFLVAQIEDRSFSRKDVLVSS
jgi:putative NADH-flavin reductase